MSIMGQKLDRKTFFFTPVEKNPPAKRKSCLNKGVFFFEIGNNTAKYKTKIKIISSRFKDNWAVVFISKCPEINDKFSNLRYIKNIFLI